MKKMKKIVSVSIVGLAAVAIGGFGSSVAHAADEPVTFEVTAGSLALSQTPTVGTELVEGSPVAMPETTVTDGRNNAERTGDWTVTAQASNLVTDGVVDEAATILAEDITVTKNAGSWSGAGVAGTVAAFALVDLDPAAPVVPGFTFAGTDAGIDAVYTYVPSVELATQVLPYSGSYTGTITQTVV